MSAPIGTLSWDACRSCGFFGPSSGTVDDQVREFVEMAMKKKLSTMKEAA